MPLFTTVFVPPDPPVGLLIETEVLTSRVALSWSVDAGIQPADFVAYQVYRSTDGGATYQRLASIGSQTTTTFADYEAPLGTSLLYRVTQQTLDFESDPAEAATILEVTDEWWLVTPGDAARTFHLAVVNAYSDETPVQLDEYEPLGRSKKLAVIGEQLGVEGSVTVDASRADGPTLLRLLRESAINTTAGFVLIKTPFGEVFRSQLGAIRRSRGVAGRQQITFPFVEIA